MIQLLIPVAILGAFVLGLIALILLATSSKYRVAAGLPRGRIIYNDAAGLAEGELHSRTFDLKGKPDYIIKDYYGSIIPVEVKSRNLPPSGEPYESHLLQLGAYFILIEDVFGKVPPYGLIRYRDETIRIDNTLDLREDVLDIMEDMRACLEEDYAERSHKQKARCTHCSMAHACDQKLAGARTSSSA
ncbi:MAG: Dna2/Cas4 domain-containing protein [Acidobacteriota bacterium]|nr:MAG: Dna2/Cas4 domain-containing protein [Acidobacteriota bacterium]